MRAVVYFPLRFGHFHPHVHRTYARNARRQQCMLDWTTPTTGHGFTSWTVLPSTRSTLWKRTPKVHKKKPYTCWRVMTIPIKFLRMVLLHPPSTNKTTHTTPSTCSLSLNTSYQKLWCVIVTTIIEWNVVFFLRLKRISATFDISRDTEIFIGLFSYGLCCSPLTTYSSVDGERRFWSYAQSGFLCTCGWPWPPLLLLCPVLQTDVLATPVHNVVTWLVVIRALAR